MSDTRYQMLDADHPAVQAVIKGRSQEVTGDQSNPNYVTLKTPNPSSAPDDLQKGEDKTNTVNVELKLTPTEFACLTRQAVQRNLDIKDMVQILLDESLEGKIGQPFISSPGGNRPKIKAPSFPRGGEQ